MLTTTAPAGNKPAVPDAKKAAPLLDRMIAAWSRSFELLAESKSRFPLDM